MKPIRLKKTKQYDEIHFDYIWRRGLLNIVGVVFAGVFTVSIGCSMVNSFGNLPALLFGLIFQVVVVMVFYAQLCRLVNTTHFQLSRTELKISSSPLPWPKSNRTLDIGEISQVFTRSYKGSGRGGGGQIATIIVNRDGHEEILFNRWDNKEDPDYFAEEVRAYLKLEKPEEFKADGQDHKGSGC